MSLQKNIIKGLINFGGWHSNRKIVVIESDDWGSIRMPSIDVYNKLLKSGIRVDKCHYCSNDSVASESDLTALFEILTSVKDFNGSSAVITANVVVANPDFDKIRESDFQKYYYTRIDEALPQMKDCEKSISLWKEMNSLGCFHLQSHGREHLNIQRWMQCLKNNFSETRLAFELGVYGISTTITSERRKSFLPAFDYENKEEELKVNEIAINGLRIFEEIFGFKSKSFIAPNYIWGKSLEQTLINNGVEYLQGTQTHIYVGENKKRIRFLGAKSSSGLINLVRNAHFEPSENKQKDYVSECLKEIDFAFKFNKPAIISSHRVNYIGKLNIDNRDRNLRLLYNLLIEIKKRWPDVEFMSSDQLGNIMSHG